MTWDHYRESEKRLFIGAFSDGEALVSELGVLRECFFLYVHLLSVCI